MLCASFIPISFLFYMHFCIYANAKHIIHQLCPVCPSLCIILFNSGIDTDQSLDEWFPMARKTGNFNFNPKFRKLKFQFQIQILSSCQILKSTFQVQYLYVACRRSLTAPKKATLFPVFKARDSRCRLKFLTLLFPSKFWNYWPGLDFFLEIFRVFSTSGINIKHENLFLKNSPGFEIRFSLNRYQVICFLKNFREFRSL